MTSSFSSSSSSSSSSSAPTATPGAPFGQLAPLSPLEGRVTAVTTPTTSPFPWSGLLGALVTDLALHDVLPSLGPAQQPHGARRRHAMLTVALLSDRLQRDAGDIALGRAIDGWLTTLADWPVVEQVFRRERGAPGTPAAAASPPPPPPRAPSPPPPPPGLVAIQAALAADAPPWTGLSAADATGLRQAMVADSALHARINDLARAAITAGRADILESLLFVGITLFPKTSSSSSSSSSAANNSLLLAAVQAGQLPAVRVVADAMCRRFSAGEATIRRCLEAFYEAVRLAKAQGFADAAMLMFEKAEDATRALFAAGDATPPDPPQTEPTETRRNKRTLAIQDDDDADGNGEVDGEEQDEEEEGDDDDDDDEDEDAEVSAKPKRGARGRPAPGIHRAVETWLVAHYKVAKQGTAPIPSRRLLAAFQAAHRTDRDAAALSMNGFGRIVSATFGRGIMVRVRSARGYLLEAK